MTERHLPQKLLRFSLAVLAPLLGVGSTISTLLINLNLLSQSPLSLSGGVLELPENNTTCKAPNPVKPSLNPKPQSHSPKP